MPNKNISVLPKFRMNTTNTKNHFLISQIYID